MLVQVNRIPRRGHSRFRGQNAGSTQEAGDNDRATAAVGATRRCDFQG